MAQATIKFNGIDLKSQFGWVTTGLSGREAPPLENTIQEIDGIDGAIFLDGRLKARQIQLKGYVYADSNKHADEKKNEILSLFSKAYSTPLKMELPSRQKDGTITYKSIYVQLDGTPFTTGPLGPYHNAIVYEITFNLIAYDPYFYEEDAFAEYLIGVQKVTVDAMHYLDSPRRTFLKREPQFKLQPYTILDHLGTYGLEGYGLQPNPNDYGLHDDGSNIFTVRQDDLPFADADYAFAVEEGTENYQDVTGYVTSGSPTITVINDGLKGHYKINAVNGDRVVYTGGLYLPDGTEANVVESLYIKIISGSESDFFIHLFQDGTTTGIDDAFEKEAQSLLSPERYIRKWDFTQAGTLPSGNITIGIVFTGTCEIEIWQPQIELKPFATSFVDSADSPRATGNLQFDFNYPTFVINVWAKMTHNSYIGRRLVEISDASPNDAEGYLFLFYNANNTQLTFRYYPADGSGNQDVIISVDWDMTQWNNYNLAYNNDVWTLYVNGILKKTWTKPIDFSSAYIRFGQGFVNISDVKNFGLFSNIYFGSYDPDVWTDEFIQKLYEKQVLAKALKQVEKSATPPTALKNKYGISKMGQLLLQDSDLWDLWFSKETFLHKCVSAGYDWLEGE